MMLRSRAALVSAARLLLTLSIALVSWLSVARLTGSPLFPFVDKVEHALAFLWLAVCAQIAFPGHTRTMAIALLLYGMAIELVQWWLPWREFSAIDWLADAIGIGLGLLALRAWRRYRGDAPREARV
jgi:VanZ family protein